MHSHGTRKLILVLLYKHVSLEEWIPAGEDTQFDLLKEGINPLDLSNPFCINNSTFLISINNTTK